MVEREVTGTHQESLEPRAIDHAAARHEPARADNIASFRGLGHHRIKHSRVVVIIGGVHENEWRLAGGKSGKHGPMRTTAAVADEHDRECVELVAIVLDSRKGVVILMVVANQYTTCRVHLTCDSA